MCLSLPGGQWQVQGFILGPVLLNSFMKDPDAVDGVHSHQVCSWHQFAGSVDMLEGRMDIQSRKDEGMGNRNLSEVPQWEKTQVLCLERRSPLQWYGLGPYHQRNSSAENILAVVVDTSWTLASSTPWQQRKMRESWAALTEAWPGDPQEWTQHHI